MPQRSGHEVRSSSSCTACKLLKRRCAPSCIFAQQFAKVHKVFGASNVSKILGEVPEEQREDTVNSLAYKAEARLWDPSTAAQGPSPYCSGRWPSSSTTLPLPGPASPGSRPQQWLRAQSGPPEGSSIMTTPM
ncbi:hypothetical protein CDL15_Pgr025783 [Punica granatum]|uniref:LOB domain-containing protein n=1 Tax=Punica granatum TaxID=22663 RepID=A0A218WAN0_PUNGR|nr:hypothetical protein CDL15_Pgr025783 [Punica granatum]PKI39533.1 hypothetical protein CRG98_040003 [Punica granatum]